MGDFDQNRLSIPQDVVDNVPWPGGYRAMIPANNVAAFQQWLTNCGRGRRRVDWHGRQQGLAGR